MKTKEYTVSDLFYTQWKDLDDLTHARVYALQQQAQALGYAHEQYGYVLIAILRAIRKNKRLVDKINELQAVDIYNDLKFLNEPWYYFPELPGLTTPDPHMARSSFDEFIYGDNEFSMFLVTDKDHEQYLRRLAVTLYRQPGEKFFDKETVEGREATLKDIKPELLQLVWFTFSHVRKKVMERCKTLLPVPIKSKDDIEEKPKPTGAMWYHIKHQAARTLVFGDFDKVGQTNMYSVLDHLEILCKEKEQQERSRGKH
jgi:hypothetical protein